MNLLESLWLSHESPRISLALSRISSNLRYSKLHVDPGGLDLLIAPIVGQKEVTSLIDDRAFFLAARLGDASLVW